MASKPTGKRTGTRRQFLTAASIGAAAAASGACGAIAAEQQGPRPDAPATARRRLEIGLPTYMFLHYSLDQTIAIARRIAVRHICIRSNLLALTSTNEQIAAAIRKVKDAGLVVYGGGVIYMRDEAAVNRAFEHAKAAGFKLISISIRPELLGLLDKKVREYDIRAAIHNHGPEDRSWATPLAVYERIKRLDGRVGICHDTGHTLRAGADPAKQTLQCAGRIMDLHLKDVNAAAAKGHSTELGRGVMDIPRFLATLPRIKYRGIVGIEYEKHMKDILPGLAESVGYARGVLAAQQAEGGRPLAATRERT